MYQENRKKLLIESCYAIAIFFLASELLKNVDISDVIYYILICLIYIVSFLVIHSIDRKKNRLVQPYDKKYIKSANSLSTLKNKTALPVLITGLAGVFFLHADRLPINTWGIDLSLLAWHTNKVMTVVIVIFGIALSYFFNGKKEYDSFLLKSQRKSIWIFYTILIMSLVVFRLYIPNTDNGYSIFHRYAYFYEIIARYYSLPYSNSTSGIYGHYGLIYLPLLQLIGKCNIQTMTILVCFFGAIATALFCITIFQLTDNKYVKIFAPLAYLLVYTFKTSPQLYYQGMPHRIMVSSIFLFVMMLIYKKENAWYIQLIKHTSVVFAVLWSNDFGLVMMASVYLMSLLQTIKSKTEHLFNAIIKILFEVLLDIAIVVAIVNIYNVSVDGDIVFTELIYPYNTSFVSSLNEDVFSVKEKGILNIPICFVWFWVTCYFLYTMVVGFITYYTEGNEISLNRLTVALFGAGVMIYYINRPAYGNLMQILPALIYLLSFQQAGNTLHSDHGIYFWKSVSANILLSFAIAAPLGLISSSDEIIDDYRKENPFAESAKQLSSVAEKDVLSIGTGAFETCSMLGKNSINPQDNIHIVLNKSSQKALIDEIEHVKEFVVFDLNFGKRMIDKVEGLADVLDCYTIEYEYYDNVVSWKYYRKNT